MSELLVHVDNDLLNDNARDTVAREVYGCCGDTKLESGVMRSLARTGIPASVRELMVMPVLCTQCGLLRQLGDVISLGGGWAGACIRCDQLYWDRVFPDALMSLLRIDWRHAFDAIVEKQGGMLVRPVLRPLFREKPAKQVPEGLGGDIFDVVD